MKRTKLNSLYNKIAIYSISGFGYYFLFTVLKIYTEVY